MFKKITAIILALLVVLGTFCMLGCGGGDKEEATGELTPEQQIEQSEFLYPDKTEDFRYNKYTYYVKITQCLSLKSNIVIPDTIAGLPVYEIDVNAFKDQLTITSVSITDNVFIIGENAFEGCTNLQEVKLPKGLTSLGTSAFANSGLKHIEFPNSLSVIPQSVCSNCEQLSYLIIDEPEIVNTTEDTKDKEENTTEETTRTLGQSSIANCKALKYMWVPEDVTIEDNIITDMDENLVIYGYSKSSAATVAASSFIDFHLVQSKAELAEFKNKAEIASDVIALEGNENYKGSLVSIQIEKTFVVREKVNYLTSYKDETNSNKIITNSFEYIPANGTNLVLFGVKVTNNSSQKVNFNQLSSTIKVDTYLNRFISLGTITNSALAKYSKPNYTVLEPDETAYVYFAAEVNEEWEEIDINFGNFTELVNYNFIIKNDESVIYVGAESEEEKGDVDITGTETNTEAEVKTETTDATEVAVA